MIRDFVIQVWFGVVLSKNEQASVSGIPLSQGGCYPPPERGVARMRGDGKNRVLGQVSDYVVLTFIPSLN